MNRRLRLRAAEAEVGAALGQRDAADQLAVGGEHVHAVQLLAAHAPAAPQIAVDVAAQAVGRAAGPASMNTRPLASRVPSVDHVVAPGSCGAACAPRLDDVELASRRARSRARSGRGMSSATTVGLAGRGVDAIDVGRQLRLGPVRPRSCRAMPNGGSVNQIEPSDLHDDVVRRVERACPRSCRPAR